MQLFKQFISYRDELPGGFIVSHFISECIRLFPGCARLRIVAGAGQRGAFYRASQGVIIS